MNKAYAIVCATFLSLVTSCSSDEIYLQEPNEVPSTTEYARDVVISASDFEYEATSRTSFTMEGSTAKFLWAEKDTVGIFPDKGTQVEFPMSSGAGTNSASFDGGGWGLKNASNYYAYYPFSRRNYLVADAKTKIPVSYAGQTITGNGNLDHLGAYDYMAAKGTTPENGGLNFKFDHLGALVRLTINVAEPTTLASITLETTDNDFTIDGHVDITADVPSITAKTKSKTLSMSLNGMTTTTTKEDIVIYFMMAPTDLSAKSLSLTMVDSENTAKTVELTSNNFNFQAGRAYGLKASYENGHEYVDLGLPSGTKWATCNIGAENPSDYGYYFAWGETSPKATYSYINSKWYNFSTQNLQAQGVINSNYTLTAEYDAASVNWGGSWRMPTKGEFDELCTQCTWQWTTEGEISGCKVTGPNNNSIFLPAAGQRYDSELSLGGTDGVYWSATEAGSAIYAYSLDCYSTNHSTYHYGRAGGHTIRPVTK